MPNDNKPTEIADVFPWVMVLLLFTSVSLFPLHISHTNRILDKLRLCVNCFTEGLWYLSSENLCEQYFLLFGICFVSYHMLYVCMLYLLRTYRLGLPRCVQNSTTQVMCVCWPSPDCNIYHIIVDIFQVASNQNKLCQPEIYQLKLSRVCGAKLDTKPWRCVKIDDRDLDYKISKFKMRN